jgi:hypothetical protein
MRSARSGSCLQGKWKLIFRHPFGDAGEVNASVDFRRHERVSGEPPDNAEHNQERNEDAQDDQRASGAV